MKESTLVEIDSEAEYWQALRIKHNLSINNSISEEFKKWRGLVANADILAFAKQVKARGIKVAILSNAIEPTYNAIKAAGYYDIFDGVIASCKVGCAKPQKDIYKIALQRLGVAARESIFIDDKQYCLDPAEQMGFKTVLAKNPKQILQDLHDYFY